MNNKPTILYVEDEEDIRVNVIRPLGYFSRELFVACDGREGLELYEQHRPDIVITDIKMPNMDGMEMSKAIKEIDPRQHIIITTAHNESSFFIDAIDLSLDGYILKPVDFEIMEKKIDIIVEQINIKKELERQIVLTNEVSQLQDNCMIVLDIDDRLIFSNEKFLKFSDSKDIDEFIEKYTCISRLFVEDNNYFYPKELESKSWIEQLQEIDSSSRTVSMTSVQGDKKIFLTSVQHIEDTSHTIITFTEVTTMEAEKKEFRQKAYTDELTQIRNRTYFEEKFSTEIDRCKIQNNSLGFMMLDIDKFKDVNDTYGHQIGDDILVEIAQLIESKTRKSDIFARWGGEEFVMILPDTTLKDTRAVAQNLRGFIESHTFVNDLKITCSFGIAELEKDDRQKSIMKRADDALFRAKEAGRNRVEG